MKTDAMTTLEHVNAAPAQTWNWLRINERLVEVPTIDDISNGADLQKYASEKITPKFRDLLSGAGAQAGAWIDLAADTVNEVCIAAGTSQEVLLFLGESKHVACVSVQVEAGASAHICVLCSGQNLSAHNVRVLVEEGAVCHYDMLIAKNVTGRHLESFSARVEKDATLQMHQYVLGSALSLSGTYVELVGDNAQVEQVIRYMGEAKDELDMISTCIHYGKNTKSEIVATGVLDDEAKKVLRATIDLSRGCKGAQGSENETVVCAGKGVVNKTLPVILCSEDDVAGNHGATIGSLSPEQLFYLATRGISPDEAIDLLKESLLEEAQAHLPKKAQDYIEKWSQRG